jgi:hypothetical protein
MSAVKNLESDEEALKAFLLDAYLKSFDEVIVQDDDDYFDFDDSYL